MNRSFVSDEGERTAIKQPNERMAFPFPVPLHHYPIEGNGQKVILGQSGEGGHLKDILRNYCERYRNSRSSRLSFERKTIKQVQTMVGCDGLQKDYDFPHNSSKR